MTSMRKRRKQAQQSIRHNNAWNWSFDKFVRVVCAAHNKMAKAMQEVYAKARGQHDHVG